MSPVSWGKQTGVDVGDTQSKMGQLCMLFIVFLLHSSSALGKSEELAMLLNDTITGSDELSQCKVGVFYEKDFQSLAEPREFIGTLQRNILRSFTILASGVEIDQGQAEKFVLAQRCSVHILLGSKDFERSYLNMAEENDWAGESQHYFLITDDPAATSALDDSGLSFKFLNLALLSPAEKVLG